MQANIKSSFTKQMTELRITMYYAKVAHINALVALLNSFCVIYPCVPYYNMFWTTLDDVYQKPIITLMLLSKSQRVSNITLKKGWVIINLPCMLASMILSKVRNLSSKCKNLGMSYRFNVYQRPPPASCLISAVNLIFYVCCMWL